MCLLFCDGLKRRKRSLELSHFFVAANSWTVNHSIMVHIHYGSSTILHIVSHTHTHTNAGFCLLLVLHQKLRVGDKGESALKS